MADFLWQNKREKILPARFKQLYGEDNHLQLTDQLTVYGFDKTYFHHNRENGDFIVSIGACYYPGKTIINTLEEILQTGTFNQATIANLKMKLVGQYILIIKKDHCLYFFSDNWQVRQIFYSKDKKIIGSSFSVLEDYLGTGRDFLDPYKVFEYLAIHYIFYYPGWINKGTMHKEIFFLRPFQYIEIDMTRLQVEIKSLQFRIDNKREMQLASLSSRFVDTLGQVIENPGFRDQPVGLTLTGGYDSRLISSIAARYYEKSEPRVGISREIPFSQKDAAIAEKVARRLKRPLRKLATTVNAKETFDFYTEGMSPVQNFIITPIIEDSGRYTVGFGGIFGTELFKPIPEYANMPDFVMKRIAHARTFMKADENLWQQLEAAINEEFHNLEKHYLLSEKNINDYIRILHLLDTGFFGSFMLAPYNIKGLQVEPYGHFKIVDLVMKLPSSFKPGSLLMSGGFFQKQALAKVNYPVGKIITTHKRPMLPMTIRTLPVYLYGYFLDKCRIYFHIFKNRLVRKKGSLQQDFECILDDIHHIPNGTEVLFKKRIEKKYQ
ncbi:MAG: asparagine synthase-related protein [Candidatus Aminicenantes bacterium]|jgi:hypothetical protein